MLDNALSLAPLRVFPVEPGGKRAILKDWPNKASAEPEAIRLMWLDPVLKLPHPYNIGVAMGQYGDRWLFALDVDPKHGGHESLAALIKQHGKLPATATVNTPSGGKHYYFTSTIPIGTGTNVLGPGLDIRGAGGYVVGPGSMFANGKSYEVETDGDIADAPEWVIERCKRAPAQDKARAAQEAIEGVDAEQAKERAVEYLHNRDTATQGERNEKGYIAACNLKDLGVDQPTCLGLMAEHWKCEPMLDQAELEHVVRSAYTYGKNAQGAEAPEAVFSKIEQTDVLEPKPVERVLFDPNATRVGPAVFADDELPPPQMIIEDMMPAKVGQESAVGGVGKTTRHQWEAIHIILGRELYGCRIAKSGGVLLITQEDERADVLYRLQRIAREMDLSEADRKRIAEHYHVLDLVGANERLVRSDRDGNLQPTNLSDRIIRSYGEEGLVLVEFDPLSAFGPGERFVNDGEVMSLMTGARIAKELGCAVRFTHHVSKAVYREGTVDAHAGRGGSALGDNSRFVWTFLRHEQGGKAKEYVPPASARQAAARNALYRLHVPKCTYAPYDPTPIWIERDGWRFIQHAGAPATAEDTLQEHCARLRSFLLSESAAGAKHTRQSLEDSLGRVGLKQRELRTAVGYMRSRGELLDAELPASERQGGRKTYLLVVKPIADEPLPKGQSTDNLL
jgi:hypothetical protein